MDYQFYITLHAFVSAIRLPFPDEKIIKSIGYCLLAAVSSAALCPFGVGIQSKVWVLSNHVRTWASLCLGRTAVPGMSGSSQPEPAEV
jgi:hypothetical protein